MAQRVKRLSAMQETQIRSLGQEDPPWRRKWQPTPVLLPGKSHGQRSLVGYSRGGHKESDTTEQLHVHVNFSSYHDFAFSVNSHGIHPFAQSKVLDYFPSYLTCNMSSNSAVSSSRDVLIQLLHLPCRYLIQVTISLYLDDCTSFLLPLLPPGYSRTAIRANPTKMCQTT